jgi:hypothetical protein
VFAVVVFSLPKLGIPVFLMKVVVEEDGGSDHRCQQRHWLRVNAAACEEWPHHSVDSEGRGAGEGGGGGLET